MIRKSTGEYPANWKEIAKAVKDAALWKCVRCGKLHDPENGYTLTVHHLDINPANCAWWNLPALCQRCHLQIQSKVVMEREYMFPHTDWFRPYVAAYYASREHVFHPTMDYFISLKVAPREMILSRLDEFLSLGMVTA